MKVLPTLEGGLRLTIEHPLEWEVLAMVEKDAHGSVSDQLCELMDEDAMWEDLIKPDLDETFRAQISTIEKNLRSAKREDDDEVVIEPEGAEGWYGALNQARLNLERRYKLHKLRDEGDLEVLKEEVRGAFFRDRFYCHLQTVILDYVME